MLMNNKKYSVLMSVYKKENPENFKTSIESMVNQSLIPDQIVIVKDGPITEELDKVINYYVLKYTELFTIVVLEENMGLGKALNVGIRECRNELVARMDTDDISLEKRCELQVDKFKEDEELDILGTNIDEFYDNPNEIVSSRIVPVTHNEIIKYSRRRCPFNHPTIMYKKSVVLKNGGYRDLRRNQDFDLFVKMLNNGCIGSNINESMLLFRADKDNLKRRKTWENCKGNIMIIYDFWKRGYSSFIDFILVTISHLFAFISPSWLFEKISEKFLRKTY